MKIELNDETINDYANQRLKQLVDQKVKERLAEIQWYKTVDHAVYECVSQQITNETVQTILKDIDRTALIQTIAKDMAELLVEKLYEG